jgi:hypothetical protein
LVESKVVSAESMDSLLALQAEGRGQGNHQRLGKLLLDGEHCTTSELLDAVGYTAEAGDILARICTADDRKHGLANLLQKWTPGMDSLFKMALDAGLISFEELVDANNN